VWTQMKLKGGVDGFSPTMVAVAWFGLDSDERTMTPVRSSARVWTLGRSGEGLNLERGQIHAGRGNRQVEVLGGLLTGE
jgi:hypothetical protein